MRRSLKRNLMPSKLSPRLKLKSNFGNPSLRLKALVALTNWRAISKSFAPDCLKLRRPLILSIKRCLVLRRPNTDLKENWKNFNLSMSEFMQLLSLLRREAAISIR